MKNTFKLAVISAFVISMGATAALAETTGQYIDDATITAKVKSALLDDSSLKALHVSVETNKGTVQLGGVVDTKSQESEAIKVANRIDGVKSVQDVMTVRSTQNQ